MVYLSLTSKVPTTKYEGRPVSYIAQIDPQYLIWLHNSCFKYYLGKSVFIKLGLWNTYKNTEHCKTPQCLIN